MNLIEYLGDSLQKDEDNILITKSSNTFQEHKFKLKDELGEPKDLQGAKAHLYIANDKNIIIEKEMSVDVSESVVSFHFYEDENIPHGDYFMEIKVTYDEGEHFEVFPSKTFIPVKVVEDIFSRENETILRTSLSIIIERAVKAVAETTEKGDYARLQGEFAKAQGEYAQEHGGFAKTQGEYAEEQGTFAENQGEYAETQGDYAKTQGTFAKEKGEYAEEQGGYAETHSAHAETQGDYAKTQGDYAKNQGEYAEEYGGYIDSALEGILEELPANKELRDLRIAKDGTVYPTAKERLDEENDDLSTSLGELIEDVGDFKSLTNSKIAEVEEETPLASTTDIEIFVSPSGSDEGDGGSGNPVKTLGKAISLLPDIIRQNHIYTINLMQGTWSEDLIISHIIVYGQLIVKGTSANRENHKVHRVVWDTLLGRTELRNITTTVKDASGPSVELIRCAPHVEVNNIKAESNSDIEKGVERVIGLLADYGTQVRVRGSEFSGKRYGIRANVLSKVFSSDNSGDDNTFGVGARWGGQVATHGSQPLGNTLTTTDSGGTISQGYGSVTGISRDEPGLVSSSGMYDNIKNYIFIPSTFGITGTAGSGKAQFRIRLKARRHGVHSFKVNYASQINNSNAQFTDYYIQTLIKSSIEESTLRSRRSMYLNSAEGSVFLRDTEEDEVFDLIIKTAGFTGGRFSINMEASIYANSGAPEVIGAFLEEDDGS